MIILDTPRPQVAARYPLLEDTDTMPRRYYLYLFFIGIPLFCFSTVLLFAFWAPMLFFVPILIMILFFIRIRRQRMVLVLVQTAMETNTPIHEMLESYAASCWGPWYREKVLRFADSIRDGHSVAAAAVANRGILRYDAVGLIRLNGDSRQLGELLAETVDLVRKASNIQLQSIFRIAWFCGYIPFLILLPAFYMVFIMPKMEQIFKDFNTQLPMLTFLLISATHVIFHYAFFIIPLLTALAFSPFVYFIVRSGVFPWRPPGVRGLLRNTDAAHFLRIFAAGLEMNKPISEIVDSYRYVVPSRYLRSRAERFGVQVEQGADWVESLRSIHWLSKNEADLSAAAVRTENVPEMLREIALAKEQRQIASDNAMGRIFFLMFVLGIGMIVAVFAIGFFLPLIELINSLSL